MQMRQTEGEREEEQHAQKKGRDEGRDRKTVEEMIGGETSV